MRLTLTTLVLFLTALLGRADAHTIAVQKLKGKKRTGAKAAQASLQSLFEGEGHTVVLVKSSDRVSAKAAGATYLVTTSLRRKKGRYRLNAQLVDLEQDTVLDKANAKYKQRQQAPSAGLSVGEVLLRALPAVAPEPEPEPAPPPPEPEPEPEPVVEAEPEPARAEPEPSFVQVRVGVGTQLMTNYTVSAQDRVSGLAYRLGALLLIQPSARVQIPSTSLGVELDFAFSPASFALATDPPVTPNNPGALFLNVGGNVTYDFEFGDMFALVPYVGFFYESMGVDEQTPDSVVVSYSVLVPKVGARARVEFSDFEATADLGLRIAVGYSESPATTGESGSGLGLGLGAQFRYWVAPELLAFDARVGYELTGISMSGLGNRIGFFGDPVLLDAKIDYENLRLSGGVTVAF